MVYLYKIYKGEIGEAELSTINTSVTRQSLSPRKKHCKHKLNGTGKKKKKKMKCLYNSRERSYSNLMNTRGDQNFNCKI